MFWAIVVFCSSGPGFTNRTFSFLFVVERSHFVAEVLYLASLVIVYGDVRRGDLDMTVVLTSPVQLTK